MGPQSVSITSMLSPPVMPQTARSSGVGWSFSRAWTVPSRRATWQTLRMAPPAVRVACEPPMMLMRWRRAIVRRVSTSSSV